MKTLLWIGLVVLVLGFASLVVPIPRSERHGLQTGDVSIGVTTSTEERLSPILSGVMILGGAGMMIAGKGRN